MGCGVIGSYHYMWANASLLAATAECYHSLVGRLLSIALLVVALLVVGCSLLPDFERDRAIQLALQASELRNPELVNVHEGEFGGANPSVPSWVVTFNGMYMTCDGPGVPGSPESLPCRDLLSQEVIYVDRRTGQVAYSSIRYPVP